MNFIAICIYLLLSAYLLVKGIEVLEKREKKTYRKMVGKFHRPPGYHLSEKLADIRFDLIGYMFAIVFSPIVVCLLLYKFQWPFIILISIFIQAAFIWRFIPFLKRI
jgi:nitrate/nitrite transporter NarK